MTTERTITWIPVTESLPNDNETVLIWAAIGTWLGFRERAFWYDEVTLERLRTVTHWAHLPAGPDEAA